MWWYASSEGFGRETLPIADQYGTAAANSTERLQQHTEPYIEVGHI